MFVFIYFLFLLLLHFLLLLFNLYFVVWFTLMLCSGQFKQKMTFFNKKKKFSKMLVIVITLLTLLTHDITTSQKNYMILALFVHPFVIIVVFLDKNDWPTKNCLYIFCYAILLLNIDSNLFIIFISFWNWLIVCLIDLSLCASVFEWTLPEWSTMLFNSKLRHISSDQWGLQPISSTKNYKTCSNENKISWQKHWIQDLVIIPIT